MIVEFSKIDTDVIDYYDKDATIEEITWFCVEISDAIS